MTGSASTIGVVMFIGMMVLMALRMPIAAAMFIPGAAGYWLMTDTGTLLNLLKGNAVARLTVYELSVIPLFLLMGQFASQGGLSRDLFRAATALVGHVRGGLAMASLLSSGAFGAVCGSSVATSATTGRAKWQALGSVWPIAFIFVVVFGGIYGGLFSPTEGAAVGAALTLLVGLLKRELSPQGMRSALLGTAETTAMVFMIFLGADMMNATLALTEMPKLVAQWVTHLPIPGIAVVLAVLLLYVLLGCVMDELSMLLLTIPVIFPAIMALDLWGLKYEAKALWFGILVLMTVGIGMIAPPIGLNVYVVNSMAKDVPMAETYKGVMPFLVWDALRLLALLCFPVLALGLVKLLFP